MLGRLANCQMEGIGTRTAVSVRVVIPVNASRCVFRAMPCITLAGGLRSHVMGTVVDCQVKGIGTRTALLVLVGIGICARYRIGLTVARNPGETLTSGLGNRVMSTMIDGQV